MDLGAWDVKASVDGENFGSDGTVTTDSKWNFQGGLGYALSDKWNLEYVYHDLNTKYDGAKATDGDEHEVNLVYSLNKNFAVYGGWNRIKNSVDVDSFSKTNNIAQLGLIAKAPLAKNFDIYGKAAIGTKKTTIWEAGLGYTFAKDFDLSAGYRYVNTKLVDKGPFVTLSYRFGGHKDEAPAPVYVTPAPAQPAETPHTYNDYYLESIHFDFDVDTPVAYDQGKLDHFVAVAKEYPHDTFKLVGNTDAKGTDSTMTIFLNAA